MMVTLLFFLCFLAETSAQCSNNQGRTFGIGSTECVLLSPYYAEPQWATCLTEEYIMRRGEFHCRDPSATECWFQCQLELHGQGQGAVYDDCRCSTAGSSPIDGPILQPECFSPGSIQCNWYRECLEVRYPCEDTDDAYAISYAERYCNLFANNYNDFSASGRQWVDEVRKCLQLALVPSLRPWLSKSCAEISREAFDSHPGCYLNPGSGAPSICNLPCSDAWTAFYVVNVVGDALTSAPVETGVQMLRVIKGCFGRTGCAGILSTTLILTVPGYGLHRARSFVAGKIGQFVASTLNLADNDIGWFPYYEDLDDEEGPERRRRNEMDFENNGDKDKLFLLLADLQSLGESSTKRQTLDEIVKTFANTVSSGLLSQISVMINDTEINFAVTSLGECGDTFCTNTTDVAQLATAPPPSGAKNLSASLSYILYTAFILYYAAM